MRTLRSYGFGVVVLIAAASLVRQTAGAPAQAGGSRFTTLPGFVVEQVTPPAKTQDSYINMTFDSLGRPVVAKEGDGPRTLLDSDGDGIYESERVFSDQVRDCQGLWFDARTLYGVCVGAVDNQMGLYRMEDTNSDDVADKFERVSALKGSSGGHGPHAIRRGPDGQPTLMLGNMSGVPDDLIDPGSPLRNSKESQLLERYADARGHAAGVWAPGGTIVRLNRDKNNYTVLSGGFRNPYDIAFNLAGEVFNFDADMEWDINLPWFREVRSVHAIPGADYGWRNGSGKFPAYYLDTLPPVRDLGRGSPVGVEFYQSFAYPKDFYDNFFEADWSRGRLLYTAVTPNGATYSMRDDKAEFVHGEPLNITDVEVGPDGMIYFCTGGWTTDGGLYRVRYTGPAVTPSRATEVLAIVRQAQPLSSWGWAALERVKASMGAAWARDLEGLARDPGADGQDRAQAVLMLQRHGAAPGADVLRALVADQDAKVRAAAVYVAGVQLNDGAKSVAVAALKDAHPFVRRRAAEALVRQGLSADQASFAPVADIYKLLNDTDRFVRYAGRLALERTPRGQWKDRVLKETNPLGAIEGMYALVRTATSEADLQPLFDKQLAMLKQVNLSVENKLRLVRAFQLTAMETPNGPSPALRRQVHTLLIGQFPAKDERWSRELAWTLAYCGQPDAIGKILAAMPAGDTNQPLQIHYIYALRAIKEGWTAKQRAQLMNWYSRAVAWRGGASFSGYINLLFDSSVALLDEGEKQRAYQAFPQFAPLTAAELTAAAARSRGAGAQNAAALRSRGVETVTREEILEYQIFVPTRHRPSPGAGRVHFESVCASCHQFGALGTSLGPDLTTINSRFKKKDILEAILWPSRTIADQYQSTIVETREGEVFSGLIVREDALKVVLRPDQAERPIEIAKAQIKDRRTSKISTMPDGLIDRLTQEQIADLLAFLQSVPPTTSAAIR
jgi:putative heme-binding domain-containing protein